MTSAASGSTGNIAGGNGHHAPGAGGVASRLAPMAMGSGRGSDKRVGGPGCSGSRQQSRPVPGLRRRLPRTTTALWAAEQLPREVVSNTRSIASPAMKGASPTHREPRNC